MKIDKKYKLEAAASKDSMRLALNHIAIARSVDDKTDVAVATDGKMLAVVPIEMEEGDSSGGLISKEALKRARQFQKNPPQCSGPRRRHGRRVSAGDPIPGSLKMTAASVEFPDRATLPRDRNARYPKWQDVMPKPDSPITFEVGLNPFLLQRLAQALGRDEKNGAVILRFKTANEPILVEVENQPAIGVLMPVKLLRNNP